MTTRARKNDRRNIRLKVAIIESGKTQRRIASMAKFDEQRVSQIIRGVVTASEDERNRLSLALKRNEAELFDVVPA